MLDKNLKSEIQSAYSAFLQNRGLKPRVSQKQMVAHIARTLGGIKQTSEGERDGESHICVVEAGTGTGKTLAYLLSAVPIAKSRKKKVVVATATVALQEQLVLKDLPQLISDAGLVVRYSLAKGRGRYFCLSQAERHLEDQGELGQMALYEDEIARKLEPEVVEQYRTLLDEFASGRWDGDRDSLKDAIADDVWQPLTSDHLQCTNRRCPHFSICPFFQARQALDSVDLIVANHDLVLADLSLGGGAILPDPADTVYIFDEGHHLGDKTTGHFAYSMRVRGSQRWLSKTTRTLNKMLQDCGGHIVLTDYVQKLSTPFADLETGLEQMQLILDGMFRERIGKGEKRFRFAQGVLPPEIRDVCSGIAASSEKVVLKFEQIVDLLKESMDGEIADIQKDIAERWYPQVGVLLSRAQAVYWLARSYAKPDPEGKSPTARWISAVETADGDDMECRSSPVSAADTLREHLWQACYGAVLTSATLTALGTFSRVSNDLGLPDGTTYERLASPFDFYSCGELYVPAMRTDPKTPDEHTEEVAEYLDKQLPNVKAALVLFSSWRQMFTVLERLPDSIKNSVLVQGDLAKHEIISRHKKQIDNDEASIIFGLASFAEGVDLPGQYLTEVIITKLPFGVPDDPVDATMAEWIETQGGNAFEEWAVPMVSMRLTQATGRLLRTEQDRGTITLLDRRVVSRRYGRKLLDALPPYRRNFA
ncbi:ATP-dependent DNA helicase DinG [Pontibacterium granulatum]|uniref:ATP-dependent DNA helicase DinG n=1 Tax=Pontibacterium granulatum TaxID=2036029 RepID=UPI002499F9E9|nr:ATP-dependent DNA helicase DinG [Pontibacterium granulatum]MDI3324979.1 ATP-dependent DNA helicase DinG [Pontibacterium granulatum]